MRDFEYFRPQTIHGALTLYKKGGAGAKLLAGGTELINEMRSGKAQPEHLIDLKFIPEMDFMRLDSDGLKIGALYRVRDAETSLTLRQSPYSALSHAAGVLGSPQVRNKATIVGNLCRCSPSADLIPPLMAMNARAHIKVDGAERIMAVEDMPLGPGKTALMPGDIVTELDIPRMQAHAGCSYYKVSPRKSLDLAVVGVAAYVRTNSQISKCIDARIVLGAVAPTAMRTKKAEFILIGSVLSPSLIAEAAEAAAEESMPIDDVRSSAWYRKKMVAVATRRAITQALEQIKLRMTSYE
jgi:carbon-monoxide dehydrogenase medium subunit